MSATWRYRFRLLVLEVEAASVWLPAEARIRARDNLTAYVEATVAMAGRYAQAMGHSPLCASRYGSGTSTFPTATRDGRIIGTYRLRPAGACNCGYDAIVEAAQAVQDSI